MTSTTGSEHEPEHEPAPAPAPAPAQEFEELPVSVSRRIAAPAHEIFQILSDPSRHMDIDGSGMLRGAVTETRMTGIGDVFVMRMHFSRLGDYEMNNHIVEFEEDRRIGWEPVPGHGHPDDVAQGDVEERWGHRWSFELTPDGPDATVVTELYDCSRAPENERIGMDDGRVWVGSMTTTLERLEAVCTQDAESAG